MGTGVRGCETCRWLRAPAFNSLEESKDGEEAAGLLMGCADATED